MVLGVGLVVTEICQHPFLFHVQRNYGLCLGLCLGGFVLGLCLCPCLSWGESEFFLFLKGFLLG